MAAIGLGGWLHAWRHQVTEDIRSPAPSTCKLERMGGTGFPWVFLLKTTSAEHVMDSDRLLKAFVVYLQSLV